MEKILNWIKKNILGLEPPKRGRKKVVKKAKKLKKLALGRGIKSSPVKKKKIPVKAAKEIQRPAKSKVLKKIPPVKNFKKNSDQLLKVSETYLKKPAPAKVSKKAAAPEPPPPAPVEKPDGVKVGVITHFFPNVNAAIIKVSRGTIKSGEQLHFKGVNTDFKIIVKSIQMNRQPIETAVKGQEIGIQVPDKVREGDEVYKVSPKKKKSAS